MRQPTQRIPDVTRRKRIPAWAIRWAVDQIAERFAPRKIILFGSYARGNPRPESDVDLLVVMRTKREGDQSLLIRQAIECPFGLDLIVCTPRSLARRLKHGDFFLREIMKEGKVVYEAADR
jgi:predicted nucleotidyltransferase